MARIQRGRRVCVGRFPRQRSIAHACGLLLATILLVACGKQGPDLKEARPRDHAQPVPVEVKRRAVTVSPSGGESAAYTYDGAGNVLRVRAASGASLNISSFSPAQGCPGQFVTVNGAGFAALAAMNAVDVGGTQATVVSATPTALTIQVPRGAATGRIAVSANGRVATSASDFTVVTGVVISDFNPKVGKVGTVLSVTGYNFDPNAAMNAISVGGGTATAGSATVNSLVATVGANATPGRVTITAAGSTGTSAADFLLLPNNVQAADVGFTSRATLETATSVSIDTAGKVGMVLFDGEQGQHITLYVSGNTYPGSTTLTIYTPAGASFFTRSLSSGTVYKLVPNTLPSTGTYLVALEPSATSTGTANITVFEEAAGTLVVGGDTLSLSMAAGQNGRLTFDAQAGDRISLALPSATVQSSVGCNLYGPSGSLVTQFSVYAGPGRIQLPQAGTTGTYTITLVPTYSYAASLSLLASGPVTGSLPRDGTATACNLVRPGQECRFTFTGNTGSGVTIRATLRSTFTSSLTLTAYDPGGTRLAFTTLSSTGGSWYQDTKLDLGVLSADGTYTVTVVPASADTGTVDLGVLPEISGALAVDGAATSLGLLAAQNGRYVFAGTAGEYLGLAAADLATEPAASSVAFAVIKPDGSALDSGVSLRASGTWHLPQLPTTGTYTLTVKPFYAASATAALLLSRAATGVLTADGTATTATISRPGQTARYTFSGTAGQGLTLQSTAGSTFTGNTSIAVYQPSGALLCPTCLTSQGRGTSIKLDLGLLPVNGTYTLYVSPSGLDTGTETLRIIPEDAGTLSEGDAARSITLGTAQNGRFTFTGTTGDLRSLVVSSLSTTPSGATVAIAVLKPDGSSLVGKAFLAAGTWQIPSLPATGTYSVTVKPAGTAAASLGLQLLSR